MMKCLKYFLCILIVASCLCVVPSGCGSGEASKIDPSGFEPGPLDGAEGEEGGEGYNYEGDPYDPSEDAG